MISRADLICVAHTHSSAAVLTRYGQWYVAFHIHVRHSSVVVSGVYHDSLKQRRFRGMNNAVVRDVRVQSSVL